VFCRIVAGELPAAKLDEDAFCVAILDIRPLVPGHALVMPKAHCSDLRDCTPEALGPLLASVQRVATALLRAVDAQGFNLIVANGAVAGQEVFHLHLHLLPRKEGDGFTRRSLVDSVRAAPTLSHAQLEPLAEKVRGLLAASPGSPSPALQVSSPLEQRGGGDGE